MRGGIPSCVAECPECGHICPSVEVLRASGLNIVTYHCPCCGDVTTKSEEFFEMEEETNDYFYG